MAFEQSGVHLKPGQDMEYQLPASIREGQDHVSDCTPAIESFQDRVSLWQMEVRFFNRLLRFGIDHIDPHRVSSMLKLQRALEEYHSHVLPALQQALAEMVARGLTSPEDVTAAATKLRTHEQRLETLKRELLSRADELLPVRIA